VRQLFPEAVEDVDAEAVHAAVERVPPEDRPYVLVNMIESVDGGTAVDGVSGALGGEADRQVFRAIRTVPDLVLVAARTANAENYKAPVISEATRAARVARGQAASPRLAVVTGELSVDLSLAMFTDPGDARPLVLTSEAAPLNRRDEVEAVAEVLVVGEEMVDLGEALRQLRRRGIGTVLCEGGPSLNGGMVGLDLVDEWNVSLSPTLAGGESHRIVNTAPPGLRHLRLGHVLEQDGLLFLRYAVDRG
jgi:riboflavin biosynthesis pyrimidine reductase